MIALPNISFVVFAGGVGGTQVAPFTTAFDEVQRDLRGRVTLTVELINNKKVHELGLLEEDVVHELLWGDVHIILGHMHQGNPQWSAVIIKELLGTMMNHIGWPSGRHLQCPVFTQDKIEYIRSCHEVTIPTLKIDFGMDVTGEILKFTEQYDEGHGWILKLPFTTNGEGLKFCKTVGDIFNGIRINALEFGGRLSYSMLQPCLANRKEYKIIILQGHAKYVADISQRKNCGTPFSDSPHTNLKKLAEKVCEIFEARCAGALVLPLLRVDIMKSKNGLVVNELESLEACYFSKQFDEFEAATYVGLQTFWKENIMLLVQEEISRREVHDSSFSRGFKSGKVASEEESEC